MKHQCHNVLLLMGNTESIAAIKQFLFLEPTSTMAVLDFSLLLPPPQTLQLAKRNHAFLQQLKRWRTQHWSTASNGVLTHKEETETSLQLNFTTLWSPPVKVYQALIARWPEVGCVYQYHNAKACLYGLSHHQGDEHYQHEAVWA
jgi:hypothetical protein